MRPEPYAPDTEWKRRTLGGVIGTKFITKLPYDDGIARNKGNRIKLICAYIARRLQ